MSPSPSSSRASRSRPRRRLVIIPGSKSTIADLAALRREGWDIDLKAHVRRGGLVLGLCGGYQMLGRIVHDPQGLEGTAGTVEGLGLLDVETTPAAGQDPDPHLRHPCADRNGASRL